MNVKSRLRSSCNDCVGGLHLSKHENSKRILIHQHMMAHYRRLYNAKCDVDTSTPSHFKPRYKPKSRRSLSASVTALPIDNQLVENDLKFLENLSSDMHMWCSDKPRCCPFFCQEKKYLDNITNKSSSWKAEKNHNCNLNEQQLQPCRVHSAPSVNGPPGSRNGKQLEKKAELKKGPVNVPAASKLREMSVYYPPRKRTVEKPTCNHCCPSTPISNNNVKEIGKSSSHKEIGGNCDLSAEKVSNIMVLQKEKLQYLHFVQDITQDILKNEMFSNVDFEEICRKHVLINKGKLEMEKMLENIQKLREQLGIKLEPPVKSHNNQPLMNTEGKNQVEQSTLGASSVDENKLRFSPLVEVHGDKQLANHGINTKRNEDDNHIDENHRSCEKTDRNTLFNLLKYIGFDSNIAEEICVNVNEDNGKSNFADNKHNYFNKTDFTDFSGPYEIGEYSGKNDLCFCDPPRSRKVVDAQGVKRDNPPKVLGSLSKNHNKQNRILYHSPTERKGKKNSVGKQRKTSLNQSKKISERNPKLISSNSGLLVVKEEAVENKETNRTVNALHPVEDVYDDFKKFEPQLNEKATSSAPLSAVSSPVASDYSSMKDQEESVSEAYSVREESDEGRESASEIEEEIPDDVSQTSSSSGISQLTEQFKTTSINNYSGGNSNLRSNNNSVEFIM